MLMVEMNLPRYKYIVNVVIGEKRGEGVRMGVKSFYDLDTDNMAQDVFINESLFCVAAGIFVMEIYRQHLVFIFTNEWNHPVRNEM